MSKNSESVKLFRKRTKERLVHAFGGKCACCGYDRSFEALQFHHTDPTAKEAGISAIMYSGWNKIVAEIRKCVMLCANCHTEVHAGIIAIPADATRFDESFADYSNQPQFDSKFKPSTSLGATRNNVTGCQIDGLNFTSMTEAAQHFKVHVRTINNWMKSGRCTKLR